MRRCWPSTWLGADTRRLRGALGPFLHGAPLSRSAVSRIVATLKGSLDAWLTQPLADREVVFAYLDTLRLRVRNAVKSSRSVLAVVGVLATAEVLLTVEVCSGGESYEAWKVAWTGSAPAGSTRRCSPSSTATRAAARRRRGVAAGGGAALLSTSCATWSARPRSTRSPRRTAIVRRHRRGPAGHRVEAPSSVGTTEGGAAIGVLLSAVRLCAAPM